MSKVLQEIVFKVCKSCYVKQKISEFYKLKAKSDGESFIYRGECKKCMSHKQQQRVETKKNELGVDVYRKRIKQQVSARDLHNSEIYYKNTEIREFDDYEFLINKKYAGYLARKPYFKKYNFDAFEIVSSAFLIISEKNISYNRCDFYLEMWKYLNKERLLLIETSHTGEKARVLKINNEYKGKMKAKCRLNVDTWYVKHLLYKKYTNEQLKLMPWLIEEKRKEILALRANNGHPTENILPETPPELIDLTILHPDYKGYGITERGDLYSCKALFKTDVMFTSQWRPLAKRKNGCIRLNINGVKKELTLSKLLISIKNITCD